MTPYYQNTVSSSNFVGYELVDSQLHSCPENGDGGCRYADATFVGYDSSSFAQLGYIARTAGTGALTRRTIDSNFPRFAVVEPNPINSTPQVGAAIHKIGTASGWTSGTVSGTCVDVLVRGWDDSLGRYVTWMYKCHGATNIELAGGDSGSPVFTWDGSSTTVTLRGVAVVSNASTGVSYYSKWVYITLELSQGTGYLALVN